MEEKIAEAGMSRASSGCGVQEDRVKWQLSACPCTQMAGTLRAQVPPDLHAQGRESRA